MPVKSGLPFDKRGTGFVAAPDWAAVGNGIKVKPAIKAALTSKTTNVCCMSKFLFMLKSPS
jgi:hypothetical protein